MSRKPTTGIQPHINKDEKHDFNKDEKHDFT